MTGQVTLTASAAIDGETHLTATVDAQKGFDAGLHVGAILGTAIHIAKASSPRPSRLPDPKFGTVDCEPDPVGPHMGSRWTAMEAIWKGQNAIPGMLVRDTEIEAYARLAIPLCRLSIRLATDRPIRNGSCVLKMRLRSHNPDGSDPRTNPQAVMVEAHNGIICDWRPGIWRPAVDHRVGRALFAIAFACWMREGASFFDAESCRVIAHATRTRVSSPQSATLCAAERRQIAQVTTREAEPAIAWLAEGGLEEEARGLTDAIGELS